MKPANVKVAPDGKVKILDFGLAKAFERDSGVNTASSQLSHSPTMSRHMTEAGMIMGTAAYMSPEQARGKPVDRRADIWSFGAPTWSPDGRFLYFASDRGGSMGIWRIGIDEASGRPTSGPTPVATGVDVSMDLPHLSGDGATLVFRSMIASVNPAAIAFDPVTERAGPVTLLQHRTAILTPYDVSADGQWLALANTRERQEDLFLMRRDGTELSRVTDDPARDRSPYFSPDGSSLTFFSNRSGKYQGWSVRRDGGSPTPLTDISGKEINYTFMSPDGRQLLVASSTKEWLVGPMVASPDGRTLYYGAQQTEANIWMVRQPKAVEK